MSDATEHLAPIVDDLRGLDTPVTRRAAEWIEGAAEWIAVYCRCPCCEETRECLPGCSFAADEPEDAQRMSEARKVLAGIPE